MVPAQIIIDWLHLFAFAIAIGFLLHEMGLISLGHAGLLLAGAYAMGFVVLGEATWWLALLAIGGIGLLLSSTVWRVQTDIFAVVSLAFATVLNRVAVGAIEWTGGPLGLGPLPRHEWFARDGSAALLGSALVAILTISYAATCRLPLGWRLGGIRDNELATRAQGVATRHLMFVAVLATCFLTALVGTVQALFFGLVTPRMGSLDVMLQGLAAAMLAKPLWRQGQPARVLIGYAIAAAILVLVPPFLRQALPENVSVDVLRQAILGAVLYAFVHPVVQKTVMRT